MQVQVGGNVYTLAEGQPVQVQAGQTIRVFFSFKYKVADQTSVPVWASLYQYTVGVVDRVAWAQTKGTVTLEKSIDWQVYQGQIDIAVGSGGKAGLYGLTAEIPGFKDAEAKIDNCIEVAAAPGLMDMITPMLLMLLMMGMMQMMPKEFE